jgi:omega-amidase
VYIIGGSVPERENDKLYNTCISFSPDGQMIGKFRKVHLFDVDIPGKIRFMESETLSPGEQFTVLQTSG